MGSDKPRWEISILEVGSTTNKIYKVTRQIPLLGVNETKLFNNIEEALEQVRIWSE